MAPDARAILFRACCCISSVLQPQTNLHTLLQRLGCQGWMWTICCCKLDLYQLVKYIRVSSLIASQSLMLTWRLFPHQLCLLQAFTHSIQSYLCYRCCAITLLRCVKSFYANLAELYRAQGFNQLFSALSQISVHSVGLTNRHGAHESRKSNSFLYVVQSPGQLLSRASSSYSWTHTANCGCSCSSI